MAESYQDIMARFNGPTQQEEPKAANDFASYVRTLLANPNPQGGMMGDEAGYYADPFRKQNAINQAILDEELRKKKLEEEAAAKAKESAKEAGINTMANSSDGGDGFDSAVGDGATSSPVGSLAGQNAALALMAVTNPLSYFNPTAALLNFGSTAYLDNQIDAISNSFNTMSNTPYGMFSVSDANANTSLQSTPASIAAADYGTFGVVSDGRGGFLGDIGGGSTIGNSGMGVNSAGQTVSNDATIAAQNAATFGSPDPFGGGVSPGDGDGDGCCFIMLEARYGDGTMDSVVRKYRDEMMTDRNRRGYYKLAEVFVPLMRKSKVFKFLVKKTFADPLVSYGKWYYKENNHGWLFAPVKTLWMRVFDTLGGDTKFIRENGEVI